MPAPDQNLEPLPYHRELRDYLKAQERELWNWFASARTQADYTENLRMELLKSTYRLDAQSHPHLYQSVDEAKLRLHLDIPVTLYQAQNNSQPNASLYFIPEEGHLVFSGPVISLLDAEEMKSVVGHELAHYHLWRRENGEFHIADRLLQAVANDPRAATSHEQTARRYQLYTEIFADRGSLCVTKVLDPVVSSLVKIQTGLSRVSTQGYLKQAEEIFVKGKVATEGLSHPEAFIRVRALSLWETQSPDVATQIAEMIEGASTLEDLDLLGQTRMVAATRRLLDSLLKPKWFRTPAVLGHAKLFFPDFEPTNSDQPPSLDGLIFADDRLREYLCYVMLDFAKADPDLDDLPLAAALELSRRLQLDAQFEKLAVKELKMNLRDVRKLQAQAAELLTRSEVMT